MAGLLGRDRLIDAIICGKMISIKGVATRQQPHACMRGALVKHLYHHVTLLKFTFTCRMQSRATVIIKHTPKAYQKIHFRYI